jgi:ferredoxin
MMRFFPFQHRFETKYIHLAPRKCKGCGECVAACPEEILLLPGRKHHHHVVLKEAQTCTGCRKCVRACEYNAIEYIYQPKSRLGQAQKA